MKGEVPGPPVQEMRRRRNEPPQPIRFAIAQLIEASGKADPDDLIERIGRRSTNDLPTGHGKATYALGVLSASNITTVGPILAMTYQDLLRIPGINRVSPPKLRASLVEYVEAILQHRQLEPRGVVVYPLPQLELPEDIFAEVAQQPIDVLNPSTQLRNSLVRYGGIRNLGTVLQMTDRELLERWRIPNFGKKQLADLKLKLDQYINQPK